jgi:hypothetical protein
MALQQFFLSLYIYENWEWIQRRKGKRGRKMVMVSWQHDKNDNNLAMYKLYHF